MKLENYIGIPYEVNGSPPETCDCWTLVRWFLLKELDLTVPRYMYHPQSLTEDVHAQISDEIVTNLGKNWQQVTDPQKGDVVIMYMGGLPQHCGVVVDPLNMLHSLPGRMSTFERMSRWESHIRGYYRWIP